MNTYKALNKQEFTSGEYALVPIRMEDRYAIMQWRNEQIYHLRQKEPLTKYQQDHYFENVVSRLFEQGQPGQLLFSYLKNGVCMGYGGLVHINWEDRHAEISCLLDTKITGEAFDFHWKTFLGLIEELAFGELALHKIFTYAFDVRKYLYPVLLACGFEQDAKLSEHAVFEGRFIDVLIHAKKSDQTILKRAGTLDEKITLNWAQNPAVRKYALSQHPISTEEHRKWFNQQINDTSVFYYILFLEGIPAGSIRFDITNQKEGMISYLIDPFFHGQGLGKKIMELGIHQITEDCPTVKLIYGFTKNDNLASIKIFNHLLFTKASDDGALLRFEKKLK